MYSVLEIATYFIHRSNAEQIPINNKKLQKLVYYAQVWYMALYNQKLFSEKIEAWIHGPAVSKLYTRYKDFMLANIPDVKLSKKLTPITIEFLAEIWDRYGKFDGEILEQLTHNELPWQMARNKLNSNARSTKEIDLLMAKNFYAELRNKYIAGSTPGLTD